MKEALALAGGARRLSSREEEELLGLLAGFPDADGGASDRELSFSDLVEAGGACRPPSASADLAGAKAPPGATTAAAAPSSSPGRHEAAAKRRWQRQQAARQRARRSGGSRGSGGGGGDGVLLNFYVPGGLLTRSMTTPRPSSRGPPSPGTVQGAPPKPVTTAAAVAGKASRTQTSLGIGCWPALWGRGRRPAKACCS